MVRKLLTSIVGLLAGTALASAQQSGFYPAAPGPVMSLPSDVLFPDASIPTQTPGYCERPARYPVDENGNRAVNWLYSQTELLSGFISKGDAAPIATTGTPFSRGILGETGTEALGNANKFGTANGVRQTVGIWLTPSRKFGFEVSGYAFERRTSNVSIQSNGAGSPLIARPFFDLSTGNQDSRVIAFPGFFVGRLSAIATNRNFGAESNFIFNFIERENFSLDFVNGFRFLTVQESLTIRDVSRAINGPTGDGLNVFEGIIYSPPATVSVVDQVKTANRFYGYSLGLRGSGEINRINYSITGKIALGGVRQRQESFGETAFFQDGTNLTAVNPAGMIFYPGNNGLVNRTKFAIVPELNLKLGYRISNRISTYIGYDAIFLSDAVRPYDSIGRPLNSNILPTSLNFGIPFGPASPGRQIQSSDFMIHTFSSGIMVAF